MSPEAEAEFADLQERTRRLHPDNPLDLFRLPILAWRFSRMCFREAARLRHQRA